MTNGGRGKIITFYSYKGGTGRSMAMAHVAWILASKGKKVLMIDWDLEAPGLHRYFRPFLVDPTLSASDGVIDFVLKYASEASKPSAREHGPEWFREHADILKYRVSIDADFGDEGVLDFVPAGRQSDTYATRVSTFSWQTFYDRLGGGTLIDEVAALVRSKYDYTLIDSRTGVSDTAGICTVHLPDTLVACFTYNNQSTEGAAAVAGSVYQQRVLDTGDATFRVFPVPMRVEPFEQDKLRVRQQYAWSLFKPLIEHIGPQQQTAYWTTIEVPYIAAYAYEEVLAVFRDEPTDPKKILYSLLRLASHLTNGEVSDFVQLADPEERAAILAKYAATTDEAEMKGMVVKETTAEAAIRRAERVYASLDRDRQLEAQRLWLRLVSVGAPDDPDVSRARRMGLDLIDLKKVLERFVEVGVISRLDGDRYEPDESVVRDWPRLRDWIDNDLHYLFERSRLRSLVQNWESHGRSNEYLMSRGVLDAAEEWLKIGADVTKSEVEYIRASRARARAKRWLLGVGVTAAVTFITLVVLGIIGYRNFMEERAERQRDVATVRRIIGAAQASTDPLEALLLCRELRDLPVELVWFGVSNMETIAKKPVPIATLPGVVGKVSIVEFSDDGKVVATITESHELALWRSDNGRRLTGLQLGAKDVKFRSGRFVVLGTESGVHALVIDQQMTKVTRVDNPDKGIPYAVAFNVTSSGEYHFVDRFANVVMGPTRFVVSGLQSLPGDHGVAFARRNDDVVALTDGQTIVRLSLKTGSRERLAREGISVAAIALSDDGSSAAAAYSARLIRTWDSSPTPREIEPRYSPVSIDMQSASRLAVGGDDGNVRIITPSPETELVGHSGEVTVTRFSPNGELLATASSNDVRIWRLNAKGPDPQLDQEGLSDYLDHVTTACLSSAQRQQLLGEPQAIANTKFAQCERKYGRR